ncbi:MAG: serine protease Do [Patescibacteria group bacterium]|nr:serine protease Do [Patescibacteria group bacterium]MDQ5957233.1 serine protease Do [Patescibacteria group bacterium]
MKKIKTSVFFLIPIILILAISTPETALASWWNPFSWFKKESNITQQQIPVKEESESVSDSKYIDTKKEDTKIVQPSTLKTPKQKVETLKSISTSTEQEKSIVEKISSSTVDILPVPISVKENHKLEDVVKDWRPYVVRVTCITLDSNGNKKSYSDGSGFLSKGINRGTVVLTNRHVLYVKDGVSSDYCNIYFPESKEVVRVEKKDRSISGKDHDMAVLVINQPSEYVSNLIKNNQATSKDCKTANTDSVDDILIMGYPIGKPKDDISYVQGKISGYQEDYFISTATIVSGYSGGVAVSLKDNCYLGIPTYAKKDDLSKSLILDINKF